MSENHDREQHEIERHENEDESENAEATLTAPHSRVSDPIPWNDTTWNPVRGCTRVSPGCDHCYAERIAIRGRGVPGHAYEQGFVARTVPENLDQPAKWQRPRRILVSSMGDLFHDVVDDDFIRRAFHVMNDADWHTYQVLTKRADRLREIAARYPHLPMVRPHIWLGVSVEDRAHGLPRIDILREVPAAVRFLCVEPLLEDLGKLDLTGIHWVSVAGESGPRARPMEPEWVQSIQLQCESQGVPFFFKGWGGVKREETGRLLDGRTWEQFPTLPSP
jgi:protein gp37